MAGYLGTRLSSFTPQRIYWRSRNRVARGKITIIDGDPGLGKSSLMTSWIADHTMGRPWPDGNPAPEEERGVILISAEDDPSDTILPRLMVADGNADEVIILNQIPKLSESGEQLLDTAGNPMMELINFPDCAGLLEQVVESAGNIGLIVIDPLMAYFSRGYSSNSDQDVREALTPISLLAQRTGASVIVLRHLNKSGGTKALYRGGGSIGIVGLTRTGMLFGKAKDDPELRVLAAVKNNIGMPAKSLGYRMVPVPGTDVARMECVGEVPHTADDLLVGEIITDVDAEEKTEAAIWLEEFLRPGPRPAPDIFREARRHEFSQRAIKEAKVMLKIKPRKSGFEGGWLWGLPTFTELEERENEEAI